jgi:2-hydroxychromene-2-carboxylate isomerase
VENRSVSERSTARLWFDPVCPWCWITYQWLREVERRGKARVTLSLMSLAYLNEGRPDVPDRYKAPQAKSLQLGRVIAAAEHDYGPDVLAPMYDTIGHYMHVAGGRDFLEVSIAALSAAGISEALASAVSDDSYDDQLRANTSAMIANSGPDVGTPVIEIDSQTFFGPVLSRIPRGQDAVELFGALSTISRYPYFYELKRTRNEEPKP